MTALVLDAGALIAVERDERAVHSDLQIAREQRRALRTHAMIVAEVWRDIRGRQARLARFLPGVQVVPIDDALGRAAGSLCGAAGTDDPIDAALALIAADGDVVLSSDPDDLRPLLAAAGIAARVVAV